MLARLAGIRATGAIVPENQLRGTFPILGEKGRMEAFFALTPEKNRQAERQLRLTFIPAPPSTQRRRRAPR